jgi:phage terminase large subunit-like protein
MPGALANRAVDSANASTLRPNAFLRMIENRWVSSESEFIDMEWWDACVDQEARPLISDKSLQIWAGADASTKKDSTAVVAVTFDRQAKKARLIRHKIFTPTKAEPIDFEAVESAILELHQRFNLRGCRYDPYQMASSAQRLTKAGVKMVEFPQTTGNLTEASQNLYDLIKSNNFVAYPDDEIRLAVNRAVAIEGARGWRITKEKASHKIDVVVAMAQAALGAVQEGAVSRGFFAFFAGGDTMLVDGEVVQVDTTPEKPVDLYSPSLSIAREKNSII